MTVSRSHSFVFTMNKTHPVEKKGEFIFYDNHQVTVRTDRLELHSINQKNIFQHIHDYRTLLAKEDNIKMFRNGKPWDVKSVIKFIEAGNTKWKKGDPFSIFSVHDHTGSYIGSLNLYYKNDEYAAVGRGHEHVVEIGYIIDKSHWGKGYGTELAMVGRKYIEYLTAHPALLESTRRVLPTEAVATVHPDNVPSVAILKNVLGSKEADILNKFNKEGKVSDQPRVLYYRKMPWSASKKAVFASAIGLAAIAATTGLFGAVSSRGKLTASSVATPTVFRS